MKTIEIIINPKGEARVKTRGFAGASCKDASRFIEQALGEKTSDQATAEMYQTESAAERLNQG